MRMHRWVTGPGGRGDVVVCQWATSLPVRAGCGGAGLARHTIRCPTLRARTATPLARPHACTQPRPRVHCPGSLRGAGLGCVPRCVCRRGRCLERPRSCVYVRGRPRDAGPGCVPRCGRHRCLCHRKSEPCANSTHTARSRSVPSVTSAPCRPPRLQVSDAWPKRSETAVVSEYATAYVKLCLGECVSLLCGRGRQYGEPGGLLCCTQSGSSASPNGDAVCCGYAAQALERARLPPSALPLRYTTRRGRPQI
jgi:hypothetical protein